MTLTSTDKCLLLLFKPVNRNKIIISYILQKLYINTHKSIMAQISREKNLILKSGYLHFNLNKNSLFNVVSRNPVMVSTNIVHITTHLANYFHINITSYH